MLVVFFLIYMQMIEEYLISMQNRWTKHLGKNKEPLGDGVSRVYLGWINADPLYNQQESVPVAVKKFEVTEDMLKFLYI